MSIRDFFSALWNGADSAEDARRAAEDRLLLGPDRIEFTDDDWREQIIAAAREDADDLATELMDHNWTQIKETARAIGDDMTAANENYLPFSAGQPMYDDSPPMYQGPDQCEPPDITLVGSPEWEEKNQPYEEPHEAGWENWNSYDDLPGDYADD